MTSAVGLLVVVAACTLGPSEEPAGQIVGGTAIPGQASPLPSPTPRPPATSELIGTIEAQATALVRLQTTATAAAAVTDTPAPTNTRPPTETARPTGTATARPTSVSTPAATGTAAPAASPGTATTPTATSTGPPPSPSPAISLPTAAAGTPALDWTEDTAPSGWWTLRYPAGLLERETLGPDVTIFISEDRDTFGAVDAYRAEGNEYGNTGENLRNRAQDTLRQIYGRDVRLVDILATPEAPWETGIVFETDLGSRGVAVYRQPGRDQGDFRVYGFLLGYKQAEAAQVRPILLTMRDTLRVETSGG